MLGIRLGIACRDSQGIGQHIETAEEARDVDGGSTPCMYDGDGMVGLGR